jgi:hypothetical protein
MTMHENGTLVAEANGHAQALQNDPIGKPFTYISGFHNWLILSHLAGVRFAVKIEGDQQRVDPTLPIEIGSCKFVLRRPDTDHENPGVTTHEVPNHGEVVCHAAGIVEPITLSLFSYLSHELCRILAQSRGQAQFPEFACQNRQCPPGNLEVIQSHDGRLGDARCT